MHTNRQHSSAMPLDRVSIFVPVTPNDEPHEMHIRNVRSNMIQALARAGLNHGQTVIDEGKVSSIRAVYVLCNTEAIAERVRQVLAGLPYLPKGTNGMVILR